MPEGRTTRRLAAILAADVVGYSRLAAYFGSMKCPGTSTPFSTFAGT